MVSMIVIRASSVRMNGSLCIFFGNGDDEQAVTFHETGTGELRTLGFLTRHFGPVHSRQTGFGVA